MKPNQDMRFDSLIKIPVENGMFYYKSKLKNPEAVDLMLGGGEGRFIPLFLENEKIDLTIYSEEEFDKNIVSGGKLNLLYRNYKQNFEAEFNDRIKPLQDSIIKLFENDEYNSDEAKALYTELRESKSQDEKNVLYQKLDDLKKADQNLSPKAKIIENKLKTIYEEQKRFKQEYIENNPTIVSYYFFLQELIYYKDDVDVNLAKKNYQRLSEAIPNHPYNVSIRSSTSFVAGRNRLPFAAKNQC